MLFKYLWFVLLFIQTYTFHMNIGSTGLVFPYTLGALAYIKTHIKPTNYTLSGVSGGAWCSLIYHFEDDIQDHDLLWSILVGDKNKKVRIWRRRSMQSFQESVANNFRKRYHMKDVSNLPITIITTKVLSDGRVYKSTKVDKFDSIDDVVNFCLCSSYIPFISGRGMYNTYKGSRYLDGELFRNKSFFNKNSITIEKNTWNTKQTNKFSLDFDTSHNLFKSGWDDAKKHYVLRQIN